MRKILSLAVFLSVAIGCGATNTYHCDFRTSENPEDRCQERSNNIPGGGRLAQETFKETCEAVLGDGRDGACPRDDVVAGCDITATGSGEDVIDWYYEPETLESVQTACDNDGGTVVDP